MTLYNTVRATGQFFNHTFITAFVSMWPEFVIIFLCACFISSKLARACAFRVIFGRQNRPNEQHIKDEMLASGPLPSSEK